VCVADCGQCPICGQRGCEPDETCSTCPEDCGECPPLPCVDEDIACGQTIARTNLSESNTISGLSCGCSSGANGDRVFRFMSPTTRSVTTRIDIDLFGGDCDDYDVYILEGSCDAAACFECAQSSGCSDSVEFTAQAGVYYLVLVESYSGGASGYDLRMTCD